MIASFRRCASAAPRPSRRAFTVLGHRRDQEKLFRYLCAILVAPRKSVKDRGLLRERQPEGWATSGVVDDRVEVDGGSRRPAGEWKLTSGYGTFIIEASLPPRGVSDR